MTKKELEQYRSIVAELDEIKDRLDKHMVSDTVMGSDDEFPYVKHSICIKGIKQKECNRRDLILKYTLEKRKQKIEDFIGDINDSVTRRIFRYRYMDGKVRPSWQWIAFKIGFHDESYPRRKHNKFLKDK